MASTLHYTAWLFIIRNSQGRALIGRLSHGQGGGLPEKAGEDEGHRKWVSLKDLATRTQFKLVVS